MKQEDRKTKKASRPAARPSAGRSSKDARSRFDYSAVDRAMAEMKKTMWSYDKIQRIFQKKLQY